MFSALEKEHKLSKRSCCFSDIYPKPRMMFSGEGELEFVFNMEVSLSMSAFGN